MSVIAELQLAADDFELGRILGSTPDATIELETMVPLGQRPVPFFVVHDDLRDSFEERVRRHPSVERVQEVNAHDGHVLYALDWDTSRDHFFGAMEETRAQLIEGTGSGDRWAFEIRFPSHEALSRFGEHCEDARIDLEITRVYNPTKPEGGPWFGLTQPQRETLVRAVEAGYYDIPRRMSTRDLAEEFGVSDQAITERLRRAIAALTRNTLMVAADDEREV
ncbi:MAG: helix-turn-helix domain-containing protein [Haloarculaceae archaeon]